MNITSSGGDDLDITKLTPTDIQQCIDAILLSGELSFSTARSGGKGGQNVNKVETKVQLAFNIWGSKHLTQEMKQKLFAVKRNIINEEGSLKVVSQESRSQLDNKQKTIDKFSAILFAVLLPQKERKETKPTKASQERRLDGKKKDGQNKKARQRKYNE